jgi:prepilin-type N-terminal cleavage/methylation domain-containing protein
MTQQHRFKAGFSLIEVIIAMGVIAFAFVGLLGVIPSGLDTLKQSVDQARAMSALNRVSSALRNARYDGIKSGDANYVFPVYFSDSASAANPTNFQVRQANWGARFYLLEDGTIREKNASNSTAGNFPKAVLYFVVDSPDGSGTAVNNMIAGPAKITAFVTWPYRPSLDDSSAPTTRAALAKRIGSRSFLDSVIIHYPEPVK